MERVELLVIGAGVVGLTAARAWRARHPGARVLVLDKEPEVGAHASGRNSGVLHAGFAYASDSFKARFSVEGSRQLAAFCERAGVPIRRCGKLVVNRTAADDATMEVLVTRGRENGVRLESVSAAAARRVEPRVRTVERALWSPDTAVVDPRTVMRALADDATALGVEIRTGVPFSGRSGRIVTTPVGPVRADRVLNCAGAYADRVAAAWQVGARWSLVPFRGRYLVARAGTPSLTCCVYPVPDLELPFLGVHLTVTPDGGLKIGPTAGPVRWREDYGGFGNVRIDELREQLAVQARLLVGEAIFRRHATRELLKHARRWLVWEAARLVEGLRVADFRSWGRPGIRPQLVERATGKLVQDFVIEEGEGSLHVLNAISPAFTCSLPFAEHLVDRLLALP